MEKGILWAIAAFTGAVMLGVLTWYAVIGYAIK